MGARSAHTRKWTRVAFVAFVALVATLATLARADGDEGDDHDDHDDHGGSAVAYTTGNATCALEGDGRTWCWYARARAGLDVAYAAVNASDATRVDHVIRARFYGALDPGANGWASFGPGTSMSSATCATGRASGGAPVVYTMTSRNTPTNVCGAGCAVTAATSTTNSANGTTLEFRYVAENTAPGTISFIWGVSGSPWPTQHSAFGVVAVSLTGRGAGSWVPSTLRRDVTHGVLMALAWVFLMPASSATTRLKNVLPNGVWFKCHKWGVGIGSIVFAVALFMLLFREEGAESPLLSKHAALAACVIGGWIAQFSLGALRPNKTGPSRFGFIPTSWRPAWFWLHRLLGPTVLALAAAACITGTQLMRQKHGHVSDPGVRFLAPEVMYGVYAALALVTALAVALDARVASSGRPDARAFVELPSA